ncbi:MocR-like pyridoxine biosynthesis transcription factor PdxR [Clostridium sp. DL1XJH146]
MNKYKIKFRKNLPKYIQIASHIKNLIDKGQIEDGEKLIPIRKLSKILEVNNVTVVNAYEKLDSEGYANKKMGSGTYAMKKEGNKNILKEYTVMYKKITRGNLSSYIDFTGESTSPDFFPATPFKFVLNKVLDRDGAKAFIYQDVLGYRGLREVISEYFWDDTVDLEDILIISGAQQGIDIIARALLNVNDNIIVEKPTYGGALNVFKYRRANIFEIDIRKDGIDIELMEKVLQKQKIKCFYMMPYFQNPTGYSYSLEKKKRLLELADIYDFYIIEDDYLSYLKYDEELSYKPLKSMDINERVIYIKSFSKIFLPGIRLGYLISPNKFKDQIQMHKINTDITTSSLMQRALDLYIREGFWKKHIAYLNCEYKNRYNYLISAIENSLSEYIQCFSIDGGLSVYCKIKNGVSSIDLFKECSKNKVLITPGVIYYLNHNDGLGYFKLGFSKIENEQIDKALNIIKMVLEKESEKL